MPVVDARIVPGAAWVRDWLEERRWQQRGYAAPSPPQVKRAVLLRNGLSAATWIESGTYLGDTSLFLASHAPRVFTIEPSPDLHSRALGRFAGIAHLTAIHGLSEQVLPELLEQLDGDVNFWLDGHYSAGLTHRGPKDTPILDELGTIAAHMHRLRRVAVLVDDVRCFDPANPLFAGYPPLDELVDWARRARLAWHIEHDIFVARTRAPQD